MNEKKIKTVMQEMHLLEFYENVRHLIAVWFEGVSSNEKTDYMTDFIFNSGSWGKQEDRAASLDIRETKHSENERFRKLRFICTRAFPSAERIQYEYPILKKTKLVLPLLWFIRLIRKVFLERGVLKRKLRDISALTPENIQSRQEALRYVGLDYHF